MVVITAPDDLHHPITLAATKNGKHVFCDKPLAMNAGQAEQMVRAAQDAGVAHFTGFTWRYAPPFATLHDLITRGDLGQLQGLDGHFRIGPPLPGKEWQLTPEQRSGGVFSNLAVHLLDLVRFLAGHTAEVSRGAGDTLRSWRVWATGNGDSDNSSRSTAVHQSSWIHLTFPSGSTTIHARLQASQQVTLRASDPVRIEVHGSQTSAIGYANPLKPHLQRVDLIPQISAEREPLQTLLYPGGPPAPPTAQLPSGGLLRPTIRHLYEAHIVPRIVTGTHNPTTPTFHDGLLAQRLLDAALRSVVNGNWETP
ncbi:MAG TPA: Gfo/Idh/MocA family oxidoreductase [Chloroflexota bacterium]|nr:Gfo/Idh/MocA family oxidoreductase [Chloroflexota bacterium]